MKDKLIKWERDTRKYSNGDSGKVGRYKFFDVYFDACSYNKDKYYKLTCNLPGLNSDLGNYGSIEIAKERAEDILKYWMEVVGMKMLD